MDKPLNPMDKQLIAARFAKARNTYTREARVQQQVAEKMMQLIKEPYTRFRRVVEFGCGTGSYSRILLHTLQPEALLLNDLCREMEECVKELCDGTTVQFVPGDAEAIDFPGETDLITSCSTLQWFNDPGAFFTRCHPALSPRPLSPWVSIWRPTKPCVRAPGAATRSRTCSPYTPSRRTGH